MEKLKHIKCIFLDIDNTLTNSKRSVGDYTKKVLHEAKKKGILVVLCTGRINSYAIKKSIDSDAGPIVIADNGAVVYNYETEEIILEKKMNRDVIKQICKLSLENDIDCVFNTYKSRYRYNEFDNNDYINTNSFVSDVDEIKEEITQIIIDSEDKELMLRVKDKVEKTDGVVISNTNLNQKPRRKSYFCDINDKSVSKGLAIKILIEKLSFDKEDTICFGDSINDISMFDSCGYSVAMKNAMDELKQAAAFITDYTNDEEGVAHFIDDNIL